MRIPRLHIQPGNPDFLDLPWDLPISSWESSRLVTMPTGIHRHAVVFVAFDEGIFAIKEMPAVLARNEYEVLGLLTGLTNRSAEPVGLVDRFWLDPGAESSSAIITRYVRHAFPYRRLISGGGFGVRRSQMLDAMAGLLAELHLAGCYWGDCSLSNVLYRHDAGAIEAIMIDAETSRIYPSLSEGQRFEDIEIMKENLAGDMADIAAMGGVDIDHADLSLGEDVAARYQALWAELFTELVISRTEGFKIRQRIARLNDLGFFVDDLDIEPSGDGEIVRLRTKVGGRTFNSDRLREMTGVEASENQSKVILGDVNYFLAKNGYTSPNAKNLGTFRWLLDSFEPLIERITKSWHGEDPVQGYTDFLFYRMTLAEARGADVDNDEAFTSWERAGFPGFPVDDS